MDMLRLPSRKVSDMGFLELAKARYSVRKFSSRPVEQEKLDRIIEAAMIAPTGKNNQAWRCYVLRSDEAMEKINGLSRCIFGAPMVLLFTYDTQEEWHSPLEEGIHSDDAGRLGSGDRLLLGELLPQHRDRARLWPA